MDHLHLKESASTGEDEKLSGSLFSPLLQVTLLSNIANHGARP